MEKENYNWWDNPKYKEKASIPISLIESDGVWVAASNSETETILGDRLTGCAQGKTKEEAIKKFLEIIKLSHEFSEEHRLNYQRFVPFRKGDWNHTGGHWFVVFGIHVYFRYGKGMRGGRYIPFTKLNVMISSEWALYRNFKKEEHLINSK